MMRAPFPPLVAGGEGLEHPPMAPVVLRRRLAELYGVDEANVLPVRGALHGLEVLCRRIMLDGGACASVPPSVTFGKIVRLSGLKQHDGAAAADLVLVASPDLDGGSAITADDARRRLAEGASLVCVDESFIEFAEAESLAAVACETERLVVIRDLSWAYGLAGAPCGAIVAQPQTIERLAEALEPSALPTPVVRLALAALDPHKSAANARRVEGVRAERARMCAALRGVAQVEQVQAGGAPLVLFRPRDSEAAARALRQASVETATTANGELRLPVRSRRENDVILGALGAAMSKPPQRRCAEVVRETSETKIVVRVDLDTPGPIAVDTGVGFFDHMLTQVAAHGGFSIQIACAGDLYIDGHHTIEDCALALGQALAQALGARRGIARFGFVLPMDEAQASVSIDLGGRPYLVFGGAFAAPAIGAYPTEMTEHVFRSLAQSMAAAIHVSVTGENDHHKTEACFKAFGRALRQAIRVDGEAIPSTKGSLV